jgi:tetratricopeptide (TPR) repeat protein
MRGHQGDKSAPKPTASTTLANLRKVQSILSTNPNPSEITSAEDFLCHFVDSEALTRFTPEELALFNLCCISVACIFHTLKKHEKTDFFFQIAKENCKGDPFVYGIYLKNHASVLLDEGQYNKACELFTKLFKLSLGSGVGPNNSLDVFKNGETLIKSLVISGKKDWKSYGSEVLSIIKEACLEGSLSEQEQQSRQSQFKTIKDTFDKYFGENIGSKLTKSKTGIGQNTAQQPSAYKIRPGFKHLDLKNNQNSEEKDIGLKNKLAGATPVVNSEFFQSGVDKDNSGFSTARENRDSKSFSKEPKNLQRNTSAQNSSSRIPKESSGVVQNITPTNFFPQKKKEEEITNKSNVEVPPEVWTELTKLRQEMVELRAANEALRKNQQTLRQTNEKPPTFAPKGGIAVSEAPSTDSKLFQQIHKEVRGDGDKPSSKSRNISGSEEFMHSGLKSPNDAQNQGSIAHSGPLNPSISVPIKQEIGTQIPSNSYSKEMQALSMHYQTPGDVFLPGSPRGSVHTSSSKKSVKPSALPELKTNRYSSQPLNGQRKVLLDRDSASPYLGHPASMPLTAPIIRGTLPQQEVQMLKVLLVHAIFKCKNHDLEGTIENDRIPVPELNRKGKAQRAHILGRIMNEDGSQTSCPLYVEHLFEPNGNITSYISVEPADPSISKLKKEYVGFKSTLDERQLVDWVENLNYLSFIPLYMAMYSIRDIKSIFEYLILSSLRIEVNKSSLIIKKESIKPEIFITNMGDEKEGRIIHNYGKWFRLLVMQKKPLDIVDWADIMFDDNTLQEHFEKHKKTIGFEKIEDECYSVKSGSETSLGLWMGDIALGLSLGVGSSGSSAEPTNSLKLYYACAKVGHEEICLSLVFEQTEPSTSLEFRIYLKDRRQRTTSWNYIRTVTVSHGCIEQIFALEYIRLWQLEKFFVLSSLFLMITNTKKIYSAQSIIEDDPREDSDDDMYSKVSGVQKSGQYQYRPGCHELFFRRSFAGQENTYKTPFTLTLVGLPGGQAIGVKIGTFSPMSTRVRGLFLPIDETAFAEPLETILRSLDWADIFNLFEMEIVGDCFQGEIELLRMRLASGHCIYMQCFESVVCCKREDIE